MKTCRTARFGKVFGLWTLSSAVAMLVVGVSASLGATLNVPSAEYPTIQSAIDAAVDGDTVLVGPGTYYENLVWDTKSISVVGAGAALTIVDARGSGRCLYMSGVPDTASLEGFTFTRGSASSGAGLYLYMSSPTLTNSTITGNSASGASPEGGGLYLNNSSPTLTNNTIRGNSACHGAGLQLCNSSPTLTNNTITGNCAHRGGPHPYWGNGLYLRDSSPTLTNNTIACNSGRGLYNHPWAPGTPVITNCVVWGNTGRDLCGAPCVVTYSDIGSPNTAGSGNISADPRFVDAANGDYRLQTGSPCIDAGDNSVVDPWWLDLDGNARIWPVGGTVDMGAYEFGSCSNRPPVAEAGEDRTVEGNTTGGADVGLDGSASHDPDGDPLTYLWTWTDDSGDHQATGVSPTIFLPLGDTVVTLVVNDGQADSEPDTVTLTVEDTTPPAVTDLGADPDILWPPNHKMRDVTLSYSVSDIVDPDPDVEIAVSCNELDFDPDQDAQIIDESHLKLRAERDGRSKDGRIYTVILTATDDSANEAAQRTAVTVPHDMRDRSKSARVTSASAAPTGAGAHIVFSLSADANVTVTVLNIAGRPVRYLVTERPVQAGVNSLTWNACSDRGLRVPSGTYLVRITVNGTDGAKSSAIAPLRIAR